MIIDDRIKILDFLQWEDSNGCYTDENCELENVSKLTYEDAVKYFFGVINDEFYYSKADNIFELTYEEVIELAKQEGFYMLTMNKLEYLLNQCNSSPEDYESLIK